METFWIVFIIAVVIVGATTLVWRAMSRNSDPYVTVWGKVTAKKVRQYGDGLQRVIISTSTRTSAEGPLTLVFDADEFEGCTHTNGSECFHGKGRRLDELIVAERWITVRIPRGKNNPCQVYQLIAPQLTESPQKPDGGLRK